MNVEKVWKNANIATMIPTETAYGKLQKGLIACNAGKIVWVGLECEAPQFLSKETFDLEGRWVTPGLIDCHTHLVYAGDRTNEFEQRLNGASYAEIAQQGGGILSTVEMTRKASLSQLIKETLPRLKALLSEGVTAIEIKSGYGLNLETEQKMLRAAREIHQTYPVDIQTTFLGAHALPVEYQGHPEDYIQHIIDDMLPEITREKLADAVDGFCETIGFSYEQIETIFKKAKSLSLPVKLHAEQLSNQNGARLAAQYQALSADHLEYLNEEGVAAMAKSGTIAVLLPGAFYFLKETRLPPIKLLRKYGVPIAIATDANPGTSPVTSLLTVMNMACVLFGLTPEEALQGTTCHAAKALELQKCMGAIKPGTWCNLAIWDIERPASLSAQIGRNTLFKRIYKGEADQGHPTL